ncbi:MAG: CRISPR system precrRNA processing endoribonuclease RAMP protein Cas6 [Herpetosiphon sp.]|nr:CRISPR system precrRNA processing endoribonuclease RAMP protein Cas6 [Herpetosiphon sp.]
MPTALIFNLRPSRATTVAAHLGRATHAAILRLIAEHDPDLATTIHEGDGAKPLTVSNVLGLQFSRTGEADVVPTTDYGVRVTLLNPELEALMQRWLATPPAMLELIGTAWEITTIMASSDQHPWAGQMSYAEIAAPTLARGEAGTRWTMEFVSPVTFRQRGLNQPFPSPDLVFGSLLDKWNAFAPIALPDEVKRFASECMATSRFDVRSYGEPTKNGALQIGAVGQCTYVAVNRDRYWCACIETLARFAFWSGVGSGATRGFGRSRLVVRKPRP